MGNCIGGMLRLAFALFYFLCYLTISEGANETCPRNWPKFQGKCYKFQRQLLTWEAASKLCKTEGAELVSIQSLAENKFVFGFNRRGWSFWIGGKRDKGKDTVFQWSDGSKWGFTAWGNGQPDNWRVYENCLEMFRHYYRLWTRKEGRWNDVRCSVRLPSVCKKDSTTTSTGPVTTGGPTTTSRPPPTTTGRPTITSLPPPTTTGRPTITSQPPPTTTGRPQHFNIK